MCYRDIRFQLELEEAMNDLRANQNQGNYVTWDALEDHLKGIKEQIASNHRPPPIVYNNHNNNIYSLKSRIYIE